jgi:hypothetical protein
VQKIIISIFMSETPIKPSNERPNEPASVEKTLQVILSTQNGCKPKDGFPF